MQAVRVPWSSASFLAYLGGLTILFATGTLLEVQANAHGSAGLVLWALLVFAALGALVFAARRSDHRVTAGLLALSAVAAFTAFLGALLGWFGWLAHGGGPFEGFRVSWLFLELATVLAATVAWRVLRFPLFVLAIAVASWFFVADLVSNGGDWTAVVTLLVGLVVLVVALVAGPVPGFWLHVSAGLAIGGGLLWFFHVSNFDWIVVAVAGLVFVAFGDRLTRSSWVVFGAWGMLQTATHFAEKWSDVTLGPFFPLSFFPFGLLFAQDYHSGHTHQWAGPVAYAVTGLVFIGLALYLARRRREPAPAAALV